MQAVGRQQDQYDEVGNKQCDIERIRPIEPLEGAI